MTMNPYLMGESSITSNKTLMVFTDTDPDYSVEDFLNAVAANLRLNIGLEPVKTPLHQNWIHKRTALIQTFWIKPIGLEKIHTRFLKNV